MGLNDFILTCEKDNKELREDVNYYKNMVPRLKKENKQLKEKVNKLEILIENLKLGVTLNQEQEDLLDKVLFGGDSNVKC